MSMLAHLADSGEIDRYEQAIKQYLDGGMDAERFTAVRLQHGIYGQRQDDVYMVRIKIPGGLLDPARLRAMGEVLESYSRTAFANITTRQDVQLHFVPLADTPAVMRRLAKAGLTTREACGNTVRNVTLCPLAGVCTQEHVDARDVLNQTVQHFLRHPLTQHLPRKFKISISGCEADCAQGLMHDLAVVAVARDGRFGFKILAGGGLGHKPHEAIVVEEFVGEHDLLASLEAVVSLHHRYSDRTKRARSRIKFLVDRFGATGFKEKYREELARTRALGEQTNVMLTWRTAGPATDYGPGAPRRIVAQHQPGRVVVPLSVPLGDINAAQLLGIATIMEIEGLDDVRTTQDQNLIMVNVPSVRAKALLTHLEPLGLGVPSAGDNVVACPGTSTCRLGITASREAARRLHTLEHDLKIRVSGCHNGCAQPAVGDIGLHGEGRRLYGKLVPHYRFHFGGDGMGGGSFAVRGPEIPAARIVTAVKRAVSAYRDQHEKDESFRAWAQRRGPTFFVEMLGDLAHVSQLELASLLRDYGEDQDFRVLQLGGGECAGVTQETVAAAFAEAAYERRYRDTFLRQRMYQEAHECAVNVLRRTGDAVLAAAGQRSSVATDLHSLAAQLKGILPDQTALSDEFARLVAKLEEILSFCDPSRFEAIAKAMDAWATQAQLTAHNLDAQRTVPPAIRPGSNTHKPRSPNHKTGSQA